MLSQEEYSTFEKTLVDAAQTQFLAWMHYMYPQDGTQDYVIGLFHELIADVVQDVVDGNRSPNQSISVPPQHGKSRLLSVRAVAWALGAFKGINIAMTGFSHALLADFLKEVKEIISTTKYQNIFPDMVPKAGYNRAGAVEYSNGSSVQVRSAGTKLTGRRVDWLIVDDPHAGRAEAESPAARKKVETWFFADCVSRMSATGKIFLISTRWHPEDLHGCVTSDEREKELVDAGFSDQLFEVHNYTALAEANDPLGRKIGDALFPEQRPKHFMELLKVKLPSYEWNSQYMGKPTPASGEQVDVTKIIPCKLRDVPTDIEWVRGWDLAITESQQADFTAGAMVAASYHIVDCPIRRKKVKEIEKLYIINMKMGQLAWSKMRRMILETSLYDRNVNGVNRIGIEAVSGFEAVYQDVKEKLMGRVRVDKMNPARGGKLLRAQPWLNLVESGQVYMVQEDWNKAFKDELTTFPVGNHDDMVDAVSIGVEMLTKRATVMVA